MAPTDHGTDPESGVASIDPAVNAASAGTGTAKAAAIPDLRARNKTKVVDKITRDLKYSNSLKRDKQLINDAA